MKETTPETPPELKWIERLTGLLDDSFKIPILGIRFGLDPLIGLIPGFGEGITFSISALMILSMVKQGAGLRLGFRMIWNLLVDSIIGGVPFIGDLFDFAKKANRRNLELMKKHHEAGKTANKGGWGDVFIILVVLLLIFAGIMFLMWKVTDYLTVMLVDAIG
ncbi:MAG: DUF4112 domain-containing protein [Flammeovirgaceae bacterium]